MVYFQSRFIIIIRRHSVESKIYFQMLKKYLQYSFALMFKCILILQTDGP